MPFRWRWFQRGLGTIASAGSTSPRRVAVTGAPCADLIKMSLFLSRGELAELSGCKRRSKISAWLAANGYKFEVAADGWPRVLRAALDAKLMPTSGKRTMRKTEPDFTAYGPPKKAA